MKPQKYIFLIFFLWSLTLLRMASPHLTLASTNSSSESTENSNNSEESMTDSFQCDSTDCYNLKEDSKPPMRCDKEGNCYREPPKSLDVPHIITPRQRMVIDTRNPILRWQLVEGTLAYTIQIAGPGVNWRKQVAGDQWWTHYDGSELQAGAEYLFMVNANNGYESSRETFKIITADKAQEINAEIDRLQQTISAEDERDLAIARFYWDEGLIIDAIDVLETLISQNTSNSDAYCLLSKLYRELNLNDIATSIDRLRGDRGLSCQS